jgi:hypothetical protein
MIVVRDQFQGIDAKLPHRIALRGAAATMGIETSSSSSRRTGRSASSLPTMGSRSSPSAKPSLPSVPTVVAPHGVRWVSGCRTALTQDRVAVAPPARSAAAPRRDGLAARRASRGLISRQLTPRPTFASAVDVRLPTKVPTTHDVSVMEERQIAVS